MFAYLFENPLTGLKRGVYWSVTIEFATIEYVDEDFDCSMTCEWIPWEIALSCRGRDDKLTRWHSMTTERPEDKQ